MKRRMALTVPLTAKYNTELDLYNKADADVDQGQRVGSLRPRSQDKSRGP